MYTECNVTSVGSTLFDFHEWFYYYEKKKKNTFAGKNVCWLVTLF